MTPYAQSLVSYAAKHSRITDEEAIEKLNAWFAPGWQSRTEQPSTNITVITLSKEDLREDC